MGIAALRHIPTGPLWPAQTLSSLRQLQAWPGRMSGNTAERIKALQNALDLNWEMASDLLAFVGTEVVVIADDSGSMIAFEHRWPELQNTLAQLLDMLLLLDNSG